MKLKFCLLGFIGIGDALSLSDELKALVNFDQWAQTSIENHNFSGKTPASTALAAQRLRGMKSELITLLQNAPIVTPSPDLEKMEKSQHSASLIEDNSKVQAEGSGEWEVDMQKLQQENEKDMAIMVRHGLIDDMLENSKIDFSKESHDDPLSVDLIEQKQQKTNDVETDLQEFDDVPVATLDDNPSFSKVVYSRNPRKPKLVTGESSAANSGKSQWLTLSVVGSLAAIVLTVCLTVLARRIKSGKNRNSGTPVQKLRRFNLKNSPQGVNRPVHFPPTQNFNAAYRPTSMDSGLHDYSTNSSQVSGSSGSYGGQPAANRGQHQPTGRHQVVNFAQQPPAYPNRNRALPPPPYARIQY